MDAKRKRSIQHLKQSSAVVPVNLDTQTYLDRFENSDTSRQSLLQFQRGRLVNNPCAMMDPVACKILKEKLKKQKKIEDDLKKAQKKRRKKQQKGEKKGLRGEVAEIKRKQKIFEKGQRRYADEQEPRLFGGIAAGLAGIAAGLGLAAARPAAAPAAPAVPAAAPAAPAGVFNFDPEIERHRLAIQDRESQEAFQLAQARLDLEADQLNINRARLQAQDDRDDRVLDQEQQRIDQASDHQEEELRRLGEESAERIRLEERRQAVAEQDAEAERQRLQDLRQGGAAREPEPEPQEAQPQAAQEGGVIGAPPGLDPALEQLRREYDARLQAQEQRADDDRARADEERRAAAKAQEAQNAEIRALAERAAAAQAQSETIERFLPRLEDRGPAAPRDLSRADREFFGELVRTMGEGVGQQLEGTFDRRFGEQQRAIDDAVIQHLDRTGRAGEERGAAQLREAVDGALDELAGGGGESSGTESGEGEEAVSRAQLAREARDRARAQRAQRAEEQPPEPLEPPPAEEQLYQREDPGEYTETESEEESDEEGYESPGLLPQGLTPREQQWLEERRAQEGSGTESGEGSGGEGSETESGEGPAQDPRHARAQERWSRETQQGMEDPAYAIRPLQIELEETSGSEGSGSGSGSGSEGEPLGPLGPVQRTDLTESGRLPVGELHWSEHGTETPHQRLIRRSRERGDTSESEESDSVGGDSDSSAEGKLFDWREQTRSHREKDRPQSQPPAAQPEYEEQTIEEGVIGGGRQMEIPAEIPKTGEREKEIARLKTEIQDLLDEEDESKPGERQFSSPGAPKEEGMWRPRSDVRQERLGLQDRLRELQAQKESPEAAEVSGLLARVVEEKTPTPAERQEGVSLVDTLDSELGRAGVGRGAGQSVAIGKYPATGWSIENPDTIKHNGINPGGRVNIIGRGKQGTNTIRVNTGQGKFGVSTMSLTTLRQAVSKGDIKLVRGDSRQRPAKLYD